LVDFSVPQQHSTVILRWNSTGTNNGIWFGPSSFAYDWWAVFTSIVVVYGWGILRDAPDFGYCLIPYPRALLSGVAMAILFGCIAVPIGLATGFLVYPPTEKKLKFISVSAAFIDIFLGTAIPEELFFRVLLQHGVFDHILYPTEKEEDTDFVDRYGHHSWGSRFLAILKRQKWKSLILASFFFGLMHWAERDKLSDRALYAGFAFIAGLFYGTAFRMGGTNIIANCLTHTMTDTVWEVLLQ